MTPQQTKKFIASFIVAADKAGFKMESPYDISNICEDILCVHSNSLRFFYDKNGEPIDAVEKSVEILKE